MKEKNYHWTMGDTYKHSVGNINPKHLEKVEKMVILGGEWRHEPYYISKYFNNPILKDIVFRKTIMTTTFNSTC